MEQVQISLEKNRISVTAVIAGVLVTLASMFFLMSLAAALGFWSYRLEDIPMLGEEFWQATAIAWSISVFFGAFFSTLAAGSMRMKNGVLNAVTTWAGSYLLFGGVALSIADSNLRSLLGFPEVSLFWHGFISDAIALVAAVVGAVLGTYFERGSYKHRMKVESGAGSEVSNGSRERISLMLEPTH